MDDDPHVTDAHSRLLKHLDKIHTARVKSLAENPNPRKRDKELLKAERAHVIEWQEDMEARTAEHGELKAKDTARRAMCSRNGRMPKEGRNKPAFDSITKAIEEINESRAKRGQCEMLGKTSAARRLIMQEAKVSRTTLWRYFKEHNYD